MNQNAIRNSKISVFWPRFSSSQEARLAEAKAAKAAKEAKEAKEKRAREAVEQLRRDKATDATSSEGSQGSSSGKKRQPSSSGKKRQPSSSSKRCRVFFFEWIEASNMMENDWYAGHSRCTDSIRFAQAQVRLGVLWRWSGCSKGLRDAWPQKWLESGISSVSECRGLPWIVIEVIVCTMVCSLSSHKTLKSHLQHSLQSHKTS